MQYTPSRNESARIEPLVKSPASVRIVAQHASVAVPRSRPHLCGGVVTLRGETIASGQRPENPLNAKLRDLRSQFPRLRENIDGRPLVYLDSAATTQRRRAVLDALASFYLHDNANPAKSLHTLARRSATLYDT